MTDTAHDAPPRPRKAGSGKTAKKAAIRKPATKTRAAASPKTESVKPEPPHIEAPGRMAEPAAAFDFLSRQDREAMECTFRMINAETQLLYASDYPHWDFDLPSTIYDLPFLSQKAKHNILGGTAARLFKLPPRNEKQKENLKRFGNLTAAAA